MTSLDANWRFNRADVSGAQAVSFDDSSWSTISVPHTWNNLDGQDGGSNYYRGIGWYRKHVTPAAGLAGKSLYLKFDGANLTTDLYVNGTFVGEHKGGYSAFGWDVTSYLTIGADNVIAVKVNNANDSNVAPLTGDYTMDGGIYRHVNLIAANQTHVALQEFVPVDPSGIGPTTSYWVNTPGVYLTPTNVTSASANLSVKTDVRNDTAASKSLTVVSDIVDAAGNLVTELTSTQTVGAGANVNFVQNTTVTNPHLWDGVNDPYLYNVYVSVLDGAVVLDLLKQELGFRSFSIDPSQGAFLNGHYYDLHGVSFHQDRFNEGWAISDADQIQDVNLIQEIGATFVRLSHYQHPALTYDLLDQKGIATWSEIPMNGTGSANLPSTSSFLDNSKQQLQEMIRQNYNHPAVLVWGLFNEIGDNATNRTIVAALNNLAHQEDLTRMTTAASNNDPASGQVEYIPDVTGFNEYYGWYNGTYNDIAGVIDSAHAAHPNDPFGLSEYGAGAALTQHQDNPPQPNPSGLWHPEEYQDLFHEAYWKVLKTRPFVWEKTVWNMFDFAVDSRNEGDTPGRNDKGLVSYDRQTKKDAFYFYKANWSSDPVLYITSRRFTNRSAAPIPIKIYANMDSVTLKVNGVTIGTLTSTAAPDKIFLWNSVGIQVGTNTIEVTGIRGGQTYTDTVTFTNTAPIEHIAALTGTPYARINFQPSNAPGYSGYDQDNGNVYGVRADGLSYGWNTDNTGNARDRDNTASPDQRYDTFIHMQRSGTFTWEIAVPNGTYDVHLVGGDPSFTDTTYGIDLEGKLALSGTPSSNMLWIESIVRVTVTDGRLTLSSDSSGVNNKIDYIDINTSSPTATFNAAVSRKTQGGNAYDLPLSLSTTAVESRVGGPTSLVFAFAQTLDTTSALTVSLTSGAGSATYLGTTQVAVTLNGVTDGQTLGVTLGGVRRLGGVTSSYSVNIGVLAGDIDGSGAVNVADVITAKLNSGAAINPTNFLDDLNGDGAINVADVTTAKLNSGHVLVGGGQSALMAELPQSEGAPPSSSSAANENDPPPIAPTAQPANAQSSDEIGAVTQSAPLAVTIADNGLVVVAPAVAIETFVDVSPRIGDSDDSAHKIDTAEAQPMVGMVTADKLSSPPRGRHTKTQTENRRDYAIRDALFAVDDGFSVIPNGIQLRKKKPSGADSFIDETHWKRTSDSIPILNYRNQQAGTPRQR